MVFIVRIDGTFCVNFRFSEEDLLHQQSSVTAFVYPDLSVVNPDEVTVFHPTKFSDVQADEVFIVVMVLLVWAAAVYIFFNQWGESLVLSSVVTWTVQYYVVQS